MLGFLSTGSKWLATHEMSRNYRPKIQESPVSQRYRDGAGEALRFKFFFRFLSTTPITYAYGLFSCWTYCWTFRSTLNLARLPLKRRSATMEIRGELAVTPLSATRRFPPTRWHPRRAGTGRAPRASRCWRRRSNSASAVNPFFSCDEDGHTWYER